MLTLTYSLVLNWLCVALWDTGDGCLGDVWLLTFLVLNIEQLEGLNLYFLPYYQKAKLKIGPDTWSEIDISILKFYSGHYSSHCHRITETWNPGSYPEIRVFRWPAGEVLSFPAIFTDLAVGILKEMTVGRAMQNPRSHSPLSDLFVIVLSGQ